MSENDLKLFKFLSIDARGGALAVICARSREEAIAIAFREAPTGTASGWIKKAHITEEALDKPRWIAWAEC